MKIKLIKFPNLKKLPERKHYNDAGLDVYMSETIYLNAGTTQAVDLGFGVEIPDGFCGFIFPRSGTAKNGIITQLSPIDSGYRGPIHAIISNLNTNSDMVIKEGTRVGQLVILPCVLCDLVEDLGEERGTNWSNSTGK